MLARFNQFASNPNNRIFVALIGGISLLICVGLPVIALAGFQILDAFVPTALPTNTAIPPVTATSPGTPTAAALCAGPPVMYILLVGTDSRSDSYQTGLSDSMRIVRVDFVEPNITYIAFLRDLYVEIPGLSERGITHGKLNQAYMYGSPGFGYTNDPWGGAGLLAQTLKHNFGVQVDHYVVVNMRSFVRIVDALGGIEINLPYEVDARTKRSRDPDKFFPAGPQHLDGYRTHILARLRPEGDSQRSKTQDLILQAIAAKLLSPTSLPALSGLVETSLNSVLTDLGPQETGQLLCVAARLDADRVRGYSFPNYLFSSTRIDDPVLGNTLVWDVDFNLLRAYLQYFMNGGWPETLPTGNP